MIDGWWEYFAVFAGAVLASRVLTPVALRQAMKFRILDHPGGYKKQQDAVPYLGGLAIVASFSVAVVLAASLSEEVRVEGELRIVLCLAVLLSIVGLLDDLRGIAPGWRLLSEVAAAAVVWHLGVGVLLTTIGFLDFMLTVVWIVGITNAFNLLDNMDGLAAGLATITCIGIFGISADNGQFLVAALAVALAGCTLGFLKLNFSPAKIYMGDAGSLFIGFMLSYLALKLKLTSSSVIPAAVVPPLLCSVAVFDTSLVIVSRLRARRSPFQGGRDHAGHRLVRAGLSVPVVVGAHYYVAGSVCVLAFAVSRMDTVSAVVIAGLVTVTYLVVGRLLLKVSAYEAESSE